MVKKDKEFGDWEGTLQVVGKLVIRRFEKGITVKEGMITQRIHMPLGTKSQDVTDIVNDYYTNSQK